MIKPAKLFSPGPTPLSDSVLKALSTAPLHHRSKEFKIVLKESLSNLKILFDEEHTAVFTSTGSGSLEASVVNFMSSNDSVLTLDGGKFGERWSDILTAYKIQHHVYKFVWGEAPCVETLKSLLEKHKPTALCLQACETSTGTAYPIKEISKVLRESAPGALLIVDGVTAVGAYPLSMKENSIDVMISGSQKALGLPAGLSFVGFSKKAFQQAQVSDLPKYYFDIIKELESLQKGMTWFSSPTQLWQALHVELKKIDSKDKLLKKYDSCLSLQKKIHLWIEENRLRLFSKRPSPSLTAVQLPDSIKASEVQELMMQKGYYLATGQAEYKEQLIRIGHMANITGEEMDVFLQNLKETLEELGH